MHKTTTIPQDQTRVPQKQTWIKISLTESMEGIFKTDHRNPGNSGKNLAAGADYLSARPKPI